MQYTADEHCTDEGVHCTAVPQVCESINADETECEHIWVCKSTYKYCNVCHQVDMTENEYVDTQAKFYNRPKRDYSVMTDSVFTAMKYEEIREDVQSLYNKNKSKIKNSEAIPIYLTPILQEVAKYRSLFQMKAKMPLKIVAIMISEKCGILGVTLEDAKILLGLTSKNLGNAHKQLADFRYQFNLYKMEAQIEPDLLQDISEISVKSQDSEVIAEQGSEVAKSVVTICRSIHVTPPTLADIDFVVDLLHRDHSIMDLTLVCR